MILDFVVSSVERLPIADFRLDQMNERLLAEEAVYWMRSRGRIPPDRAEALIEEVDEVIAVTIASIKT